MNGVHRMSVLSAAAYPVIDRPSVAMAAVLQTASSMSKSLGDPF